jgi:hypothetical protein
MRDFADADRIFDEFDAEKQNGLSADYGWINFNNLLCRTSGQGASSLSIVGSPRDLWAIQNK